MGFYDNMQQKALRLITKRGLSMTLRRVTKGQFVAAEGSRASDTSNDYPCVGIIEEYRTKDVDGTLVKQGDKKIIMAASGLAVRPQTDDLLIINGETWKVVINKPTSPAGIDIIHNLQVRL